MLLGDPYHYRLSFDQRRIQVFSVYQDRMLAASDPVEALVAETGAIFWIEHDVAFFGIRKLAPIFICRHLANRQSISSSFNNPSNRCG